MIDVWQQYQLYKDFSLFFINNWSNYDQYSVMQLFPVTGLKMERNKKMAEIATPASRNKLTIQHFP